MKKVLSLMFSIVFVILAATSVSAETGDKLTIKTITLDQNPDVEAKPQGDEKDLSKLSDGNLVKEAEKYATDGIVLFMNNKCKLAGVYTEYTLTVELDKVSTIGSIDIAMYHQYIAMIGLSKDNKIKVEKSTDGSAYFPVETLKFEGEAVNGEVGVIDTSLSFKKAFDAKYLKLTFTYDDSPFINDSYGKVIWEWHGLTEIAVFEGDKTSEPAPETTPKTNDLLFVFVATGVISLIAVIATSKARRV